jgi:hypothetical protein
MDITNRATAQDSERPERGVVFIDPTLHRFLKIKAAGIPGMTIGRLVYEATMAQYPEFADFAAA